MATQLHSLIAARARANPAIQVGHALLVNLLTRRLTQALASFVGTFQPYGVGNSFVDVGLSSCTYSGNTANWKIALNDEVVPGVFKLESSAAFDAVFAVTCRMQPAKGLFTVRIRVNGVSALGSAGQNLLSLAHVDLTYDTEVIRDPDLEANREFQGLSQDDVVRMEGLMAWSVCPRLIKSVFDNAPALNLQSIFPAVKFRGEAELAEVAGGLLIIASDGWDIDETCRCPCSGGAPEVVVTPGPAVNDGEDAGTIPVNVVIPPPLNSPLPVEIEPDIAVYLPQSTLQQITSGPYPAVTDAVEDNGFVGWEFEYTIAFKGSQISLTDPRAMVVVSIDFYVSGKGEVTVEVACGYRSTIGMASMSNRKAGNSRAEIGLTPTLRPDGRITLVPELLSLEIKEFKVSVMTVTGSLIGYLGGSGLYGFVVDLVLAQIIKHNLPIKLREALGDAMGKQAWTLMDLSKFDVRRLFASSYGFNAASSRDPSSLLVGLQNNPG